MLAQDKRILAEKCLQEALKGDFLTTSRIRQQAYSLDPPGTIGVNWDNFVEIWEKDSNYLTYLNCEDFSDMNNTPQRIASLRAGIFIDYLFGFRDMWGVKRQCELSDEQFKSDKLENFLIKENWVFECENRELIYAQTKEKNISAKLYYDAIKKNGTKDSIHPHIFNIGEYYLGFSADTPQIIIDSRRKWLENYDQFLKMSKLGIESFPKTFQTFEKHKQQNSEKYQIWKEAYSRAVQSEKEALP